MASVPELHLMTRDELRAWLAEHHETDDAVWLVSWRSVTGRPAIAYEDLVQEALCVGWVDSTIRKLDEERNAIYLARRKRGSTWARTNKARVEALLAAGLMREAGIAAVERAKADGSWTSLDDVEALVVPPDLEEALRAAGTTTDGQETVHSSYAAWPPSTQKQALWSVASAKRPQTRARRIEAVVAAARERRPFSP